MGRPYQPFTDEEKERVRVLRAEGKTFRQIAADLGRTYGSVNRYLSTHGADAPLPGAEPPAPLTDAEVWQRARNAAEARDRKLAETFDWLRPVQLDPVQYPAVRGESRRYTVVAGDTHWPHADPRAEALLFRIVAALKPYRFVHAGDGPDLTSLSSYPKAVRQSKVVTLADEQRAAKSFWSRMHALGAAWGMELYELEANHSGNEQASRWRRWLDENAGVLFQLDGVEEALDYRRYFHPEGVPVQLVEEVLVAPRALQPLRIRHGEVVRKHGGYSARAHGDKWHASVMHGHTHRIGASVKRLPGIPGVRPDSYLRTYEIGCLCRLDADYCPGADWAQGLAIVAEADDDYSVELVAIEDGRATVAALGVTLVA